MVNSVNDAFMSLAEACWERLGRIDPIQRAFAVSRSGESRFDVSLIDVSSGDSRMLSIIDTRTVEHFADASTSAIIELFKVHGASGGEDVILLNQKRCGEINLFRWVFVDPITLDPEPLEGQECYLEYRRI